MTTPYEYITHSKKLNVSQPSSKAYYTAAINEFVRPTRPSSELAWEASFWLTTRNWQRLWKRVRSQLCDGYLQDFNWPVTHKVLPVITRLCTWGMKVSPRCRHWGQPETLAHALMDCPCLKAFWQQVQLLINKINGQTIQLTESNVFAGLYRNAKKAQLTKFIIDCAKRSCWKKRVSQLC